MSRPSAAAATERVRRVCLAEVAGILEDAWAAVAPKRLLESL